MTGQTGEGAMVEYAWMIMRMDLKSLLNKGRRGDKKGSIRFWISVFMYVALGAGTYYGAYMLFDYLRTFLAALPGMADAVAVSIFNGLAIYVLVLVFLTGLQVTFRTLYESDDIGFLLSQPVPAESVFGAKFLFAYAALAPMVLVFGLPVWFAWAYVNRAGPLFYLMAALSLLLLLLMVHAAVTLILLVAMRYLPGSKLKRSFVAAGAILGLFIVLTSQVLSSRLSSGGNPMDVLQRIGSMNLSKTWYLPTTWAVNAILGTVKRFGVNPVYYALPLAGSAVVLAYAAVRMSEKWYFTGWSGLGEESSAAPGRGKAGIKDKRRAGSRAAGAWTRGSRSLQGTFWTVLSKDIRLLFRDPVLWYGLATSAIVLGFFVYNSSSGGSMSARMPFEAAKSMMSGMFVAMAALMGAVVGAQTGGISLSREGPCFWLLQANPTDGVSLYRAKMVYAMLPSTVLMLPFLVIVEFTGLPHYPLWRELVLGLSIGATVASFQILLDAYFPDFTVRVEIGSSKSGKGTGKLVTVMLASMLLVMVFLLLLTLPTILVRKEAFPESWFVRLDMIIHASVAGLALLVTFIGSKLGSNRVQGLLRST